MKTKKPTQSNNPYATPNSQQSVLTEELVNYQGKVYNSLSIAIATIFGSVLATGLLIHSNYNHFEQKSKALYAVAMTALLTIFFLFGMLVIDFPVVLLFIGINFIIAAISLPLTQVLQGKQLEHHEETDKKFHSFIRAILIGIGCLFAMGLMLFFAYSMFLMTH